jgi:hypothetical protein
VGIADPAPPPAAGKPLGEGVYLRGEFPQ